MENVILYGTTTRDLFDKETRVVLDLIHAKYPLVEIEAPAEGDRPQWFVQVYRNGRDDMPEGFFGSTPLEAASRVAKALKVTTGQ
jgi:hypothetical protein